MRVVDITRARALEAGSSLIHAVPQLQPWAARHVLKLAGPNDRLLHWRADQDYIGSRLFWAKPEGPPNASEYDPEGWENVVIGARRGAFERDMRGLAPRRPAVAYGLGAAVMIGVRELEPVDEFLVPVNQFGRPDTDGELMGVVVRAGENLETAIGTAAPNGRQFMGLGTRVLARVAEVPDGLYRV